MRTQNHILGVTSLAGAVIGSYLIAANIHLNAIGYVFFLISSIASVILLVKQQDKQWYLIGQNVYFVCVNLFGLYNYGMT